jgi:lambda family phage minor tail protein L
MTTTTEQVQKLAPGELVELYELDASSLGAGTLYFHPYPQQGAIWWQGVEYSGYPVEAKGFARTSDKQPTPTLTVANVGGAITALCLAFDDLVGTKVTRRRTFGRFLDAANFPGGNPEADPGEEMTPEVWFIERKASESPISVQFELSSAMDFQGVMVPRRQIIANQCPWRYRLDAECGYTGGPVATVTDQPTTNPALDRCSHKISGCKLRFGENAELPFGGMPAAGLMRT